MLNTNSIVSEYLSSVDSMYTYSNVDNSADMFDSDDAMYEESIFISANETNSIGDNSIFFVNGRNSSEADDEISRLFSSFSRPDEY